MCLLVLLCFGFHFSIFVVVVMRRWKCSELFGGKWSGWGKNKGESMKRNVTNTDESKKGNAPVPKSKHWKSYWLLMMKSWNGSACEKRAREFKGIQTFPQFVDCLLFVVVLWCKSPHMKLFWGVHLLNGVCLIVHLNLIIMQGSCIEFMFC